MEAAFSAFVTAIRDAEDVPEVVRLSVILFGGAARVVLSLSDPHDAEPPTLEPDSGCNYALALRLTRETIELAITQLGKGTPIYQPVVFFLAPGNDPVVARWIPALEELHDPAWKFHPVIVAFGWGDAKPGALARIATSDAFVALSSEPLSHILSAIADDLTLTVSSLRRETGQGGLIVKVDPDLFSRVTLDMDRFDRISTSPDRMDGSPCIRNLRITVPMIVDELAEGATKQEILDEYPYLELADIEQALAYANAFGL
jgi:uncharacterized protein (DUF433 family)/uncharacterized protein YegL